MAPLRHTRKMSDVKSVSNARSWKPAIDRVELLERENKKLRKFVGEVIGENEQLRRQLNFVLQSNLVQH